MLRANVPTLSGVVPTHGRRNSQKRPRFLLPQQATPLTIAPGPIMMCIHQFKASPIHESLCQNQPACPRPCRCTTVRRYSRVLARAFDAALEPAGFEHHSARRILRAVQRHPGEPLLRVAKESVHGPHIAVPGCCSHAARRLAEISAGADGPYHGPPNSLAKDSRFWRPPIPVWVRTQTAIIERWGGADGPRSSATWSGSPPVPAMLDRPLPSKERDHMHNSRKLTSCACRDRRPLQT